MGDTLYKIVKWVLGSKTDAQSKLMRSATVEHVAGNRERQGDKFGNVRGAPAARVAWPVEDLDSHDGASFLGSDCFWSLYKKADDKVYLIDSALIDDRHDGMRPLVVGKTVTLARDVDKDYFGLTVRTAEYGTAGLKKNVFIPVVPEGGGSPFDLVAHHTLGPNTNSTRVYDPKSGSLRDGPLDDQFRVNYYNSQNVAASNRCGQSNPPNELPPPNGAEYAVYWNGGSSGVGQNRGHGLTTFDDAEARLGHLMGGPLRAASPKHSHTNTGEPSLVGPSKQLRAGALDLNTLHTNGAPEYDAPNEFHVREEPDVIETDGIRHRVYHEMDSDECHESPPIGQRFGKWRWSVPLPIVETPPCEGTAAAATYKRVDANPTFMTGSLLNAGAIGMPTPNLHKLSR